MIINGKEIAQGIQDELRKKLTKGHKRAPCLVMVLVGEHPASQVYVKRKAHACKEIGMVSTILEFPTTITETALLEEIARLNHNNAVDGILIQLPLPPHIDAAKIMLALDPTKDVDGFHPINAGKLLIGDPSGFVPCTPLGIKVMLEKANIDICGKHVVIVGRSNIVGKPLAALLMQNAPHANATVTVAHSKTKNLEALCRQADVLVAAIGQPLFIRPDMVREGAVVIDVGINRVDGKLVGDVDFEGMHTKCASITPVPGGVGPMTIAMLLSNTYDSFVRRLS